MNERFKFAALMTLLAIGLLFIWYTHHNVDHNFVESFGFLR
jgi:hypothetical protein